MNDHDDTAITDPWAALNARRRDDGFGLFVEQFEQTIELLRTGSAARMRMALVATDNLAEALLYRYMTRAFEASERISWMNHRRFGARERRRIANAFTQKVALAESEGGGPVWSRGDPILDPADASVFRTGHTYRNRIYHQDRHNPALLGLLTRAYAGAVGRAFVRATPENVGSSECPENLEDLIGYGYQLESSRFGLGKVFVPGEAASAMLKHFEAELQVDLPQAIGLLTEDVMGRAIALRGMLAWLLGDGMDPERLLSSIWWSEFWDRHGSDDELVRLDEDRFESFDRRSGADHGLDDDAHEAFAAANEAYEARLGELISAFSPTIDLRSLDRLEGLGAGLSSARTVAALMERYRRLDRDLEILEEVIDEAAIGWDQYVQNQLDIARGK